MSATHELIKLLVARGEVRISEHGYDEMSADGITIDDILVGVQEGEVLEDYPQYAKGPCVLALQRDKTGDALHVLWGTAARTSSPAVLITAYRPDAARWMPDFRTRR